MKIRTRLLPLLLAGAALPLSQALFPGCATLFDGPTQQVRVKSQPAGAQVFLNGKLIGKTPVLAVVSRWGNHRVRIETAGFEPYEVPLDKKFNENAKSNLYIGGVWIVVDAVTGAIFRLEVPAKARGEMMPWRWTGDGSTIANSGTPALISVALKPDATGRKVGQMVRRQPGL